MIGGLHGERKLSVERKLNGLNSRANSNMMKTTLLAFAYKINVEINKNFQTSVPLQPEEVATLVEVVGSRMLTPLGVPGT